MKIKIKSTKKEDLKRFTMGKAYDVIDTWRALTANRYPVIKDDKGFRCMITLNDCSHIDGDWEIIEGSISDLQN